MTIETDAALPEPTVITLHLHAPRRTLTATVTISPATGITRYQLTGPRLTGSVSVSAEAWPDTILPRQIDISLGALTDALHVFDHVVVNGIELSGHTTIDRTTIDTLTRHRLSAHRAGGRLSGAVPDHTANYLAAAVQAVLTHWIALPQRDALILATARYFAPRRLQNLQQHTIEPLRRRIGTLSTELAAAEELAAALQILTDPRTGVAQPVSAEQAARL